MNLLAMLQQTVCQFLTCALEANVVSNFSVSLLENLRAPMFVTALYPLKLESIPKPSVG